MSPGFDLPFSRLPLTKTVSTPEFKRQNLTTGSMGKQRCNPAVQLGGSNPQGFCVEKLAVNRNQNR